MLYFISKCHLALWSFRLYLEITVSSLKFLNRLLLKEMENHVSIVRISFFCMLLKTLSYLSVEESFIPKLMIYRPSLLSWRVHMDFLEKQQLRDSEYAEKCVPHLPISSLHVLLIPLSQSCSLDEIVVQNIIFFFKLVLFTSHWSTGELSGLSIKAVQILTITVLCKCWDC